MAVSSRSAISASAQMSAEKSWPVSAKTARSSSIGISTRLSPSRHHISPLFWIGTPTGRAGISKTSTRLPSRSSRWKSMRKRSLSISPLRVRSGCVKARVPTICLGRLSVTPRTTYPPPRLASAQAYLASSSNSKAFSARLNSTFSPSFASSAELTLVRQQVERGLNAPLTSSAGRLFDAVSALLGVCRRITYEAQAAIELEHAASPRLHGGTYPCDVNRLDGKWVAGLRPLFEALLRELARGTSVPEVSARFHSTMATLIVEVCQCVRKDTGLETAALSGGCFQNRLLFGQTVAGLRESGFSVLVHHQVPTNDGGLSLGQAVIANARYSGSV